MKKLLIILLFASSSALAQFGSVRVRVDSIVSFHDSAFVFIKDSLRVLNYVELDSVKTPPCPPQGRINLLSKGISGIFVQFSNCNQTRLDSTWDSIRVAHLADTARAAHFADASGIRGVIAFADSSRASHIADTSKKAGIADSARASHFADASGIRGTISFADSSRASHIADTARASHFADASGIRGTISFADSSRASHIADTAKTAGKADSARASHFADASGIRGTITFADSSRASHISDTTKAVAAANVKSPQNLTVDSNLTISSGTGTGAVLQALGVTTVQPITILSTPQLKRLGLGAAADGTTLLQIGTAVGDATGSAWGFPVKITSPPLTLGGSTASLIVVDPTTQATDVGGEIALGGAYVGTSNYAEWAYIKSGKTNSTSSNYSSYLSFATRLSGGNTTERMRIDNVGNVIVGATSSTLSGNGLDVDNLFQVKSDGSVPLVAGVATTGKFGVGAIIYKSELTAQAASIGVTTITATTGRYLICWAVSSNAAGNAGETVTLTFNWVNSAGKALPKASKAVAVDVQNDHDEGSFEVAHYSGSGNLRWFTTLSSTAGSPSYDVYVTAIAINQ